MIALNFFPVDAFIAEKNVERFEQTGKIDVDYLQILSHDAVPTLVMLDRKHPEFNLREGLLYRLQDLQSQWEQPWPAFTWNKLQARKALEAHLGSQP